MADPGVNRRDHPNDNADPAHENLDVIQQKIASLEKLFDQQSPSLQYLTSAVERLAKTAKRKRRYFTSRSSSVSSSSSSSDDELPKRQKTTNPTVSSDTEQEAELLVNQGKQPRKHLSKRALLPVVPETRRSGTNSIKT